MAALGAASSASAQTIDVPGYRQLGATEAMAAPSGNGTDYSANAPSLSGMTLLATIPAPVVPRRGYFIQAQCAAGLTVLFDDQVGTLAPTSLVLAGASAGGGQGASVTMAGMPHPHLLKFRQLPDGGEELVMMRRTCTALLASTALVTRALADVSPPPGAGLNTYNAPAFGACTWDSGHDVGACINAAIAAASAGGGGKVVVPAGTFGISTAPALANGVKVEGAGGANYGVCGTTLTWLGAASGVMATGGSDASAQQLVGAGLGKMCLDGATTAGTGVKLRSVVWSDFTDLYVKRVTASAYDLDVSSTANIGVMFNQFVRDYADLTDASSASANGWKIGPGSTTANTNRNFWQLPVVIYQNGSGFVCGNMDSNEVIGAAIEPSGGSGKSLDLLGSANNVLQTCRSNRFAGMFGVSSIGAAVAETNTYPSVHNTLDLDQESGAPNPTINSGASLYWSSNFGSLNGGWTFGSALPVASGGTGQTSLTSGSLLVGNGSAGFNSTNLIKFAGGCTLSNDGTSPNTLIDIDICSTAEDSGQILMVQNSAFTKTTGAWTVGSGNGGLDTGTVANLTWYYVYQIQRADTGVVDYLLTATYGAPTMPANYTRKRYIGAVKTDGSGHLLAFAQIGNEFVWGAPQQDLNSATVGTTAALQTLASVPGGHKVLAHFRAEIYASGNPKVLFTSPDEASSAVDTPTGNQSIQAITSTGTSGTFRVMTNTVQQVRMVSNTAGTGVWDVTIGWQDPAIAWPH
ncbi:MAG: hypothetical protein JO001_23085 [Alphaproteobacteria bacterium]|nr:hypothetical protein [Alphaproteobacteria bacterium]